MNHQDTKTPSSSPSEPSQHLDRVAHEIVDAAFQVHNELGPGLLESAYEACLVHELKKRELQVEQQVPLPVRYDTIVVDAGYRLDLLVAQSIVVELKSVDSFQPVHLAQLLTYLKLGKYKLGFLINFNVSRIKDGIRRVVL